MLKGTEKIFLNISHPNPNLSPIQHANFDPGKLDTLHAQQDALHTQGANTTCDSCGMLLKQGMANELWEQEIKSMGKRHQLQPKTLISNFITNLFFVLFQFNSLQSFPHPCFFAIIYAKTIIRNNKTGLSILQKTSKYS